MSSAYSYIHGKLPKTWIHFDTHGSSYEGFHLCLSELAFINQFYSILTRLKPGQNKKGRKKIPAAPFFESVKSIQKTVELENFWPFLF